MSDQETFPESDRIDGLPHPRETLKLFGQDAAERQFLDAWKGGRLHHAWLLRGPNGVGKATLAYRIARALLASPPDTGPGLFGDTDEIPANLDTPPDCPIQARIEAQAEPRLFVLRRQWDADRKRFQAQISVEHVRALRRFLQLSAADGGWRVVIVDPADEMNRNAANALLKFLEEPPARTLFLLLSHAPAGLLPTIRSRCRTLDLGRLEPDALTDALTQAGAPPEPGTAIALAELSEGSAGRSLRLVASEGLELYGGLVKLLSAGRGVDRDGLMKLCPAVAGPTNATRYQAVLELVQILLSRLARAGATGTAPEEAAPGEATLFAETSTTLQQARLWADTLATISQTARHTVGVNLDPQQTVLDIFLEIDATLGRARKAAT